jgi:hypothetical protein
MLYVPFLTRATLQLIVLAPDLSSQPVPRIVQDTLVSPRTVLRVSVQVIVRNRIDRVTSKCCETDKNLDDRSQSSGNNLDWQVQESIIINAG